MILQDINVFKGLRPTLEPAESVPALMEGAAVTQYCSRLIGAIADKVPDATMTSAQNKGQRRIQAKRELVGRNGGSGHWTMVFQVFVGSRVEVRLCLGVIQGDKRAMKVRKP